MNTARTIQLQLRDTSRFGTGGLIRAEPVPTRTTSVANLFRTVLPGARMLTVSRPDMVNLVAGKDAEWQEKHFAKYGPSKIKATSLFFQTVHACYARHYPLALRPDVLHAMILSEIATTVKLTPEPFRALFTAAQGKEEIRIDHEGLHEGPESPWHEVLPMFRTAFDARIPSAELLSRALPSYTTSTSETDAATLITFMDAASPFYDYRVGTLCGIPEIRLLGEPEDYRKLCENIEALAELFGASMPGYFEQLTPVLETLAQQAAGARLDEGFWSSIYKHLDGSGTDAFEGWLSAFVHYVRTPNGPVPKTQGRPIASGVVPTHVSTVSFQWESVAQPGVWKPMVFAGGVLGVDTIDSALCPSLGWAVLHAAPAEGSP